MLKTTNARTKTHVISKHQVVTSMFPTVHPAQAEPNRTESYQGR